MYLDFPVFIAKGIFLKVFIMKYLGFEMLQSTGAEIRGKDPVVESNARHAEAGVYRTH